jgi:hypothetical protein
MRRGKGRVVGWAANTGGARDPCGIIASVNGEEEGLWRCTNLSTYYIVRYLEELPARCNWHKGAASDGTGWKVRFAMGWLGMEEIGIGVRGGGGGGGGGGDGGD